MHNNSDELVIVLNAVESTCAVEFYTVVYTSRSPVHNTLWVRDTWPKPQKPVQIDSKIFKTNKKSKKNVKVMKIHFFLTKGIKSSKNKAVKILLPWEHQVT